MASLFSKLKKSNPLAQMQEAKKANEKKKKKEESDNEYIQAVVDATGWTFDDAKEKMEIVKTQLGIPFKAYVEEEFYKLTRSRQERKAGSYLRKREKSRKQMKAVAKLTGKSEKTIKQEISAMNALDVCEVDIDLYSKYGLYELTFKEVSDLLEVLKKVDEKTPVLRKKFDEIDEGALTYDDIKGEIEEYKGLMEKLITPTLSANYTRLLEKAGLDVKTDPGRVEDVVLDMQFSRLLLRFTLGEYIMYHLYRFGLEDKREFISDVERVRILSKINKKGLRDIVNNKFDLYLKMKPLFGRDVEAIYTEDDKQKFMDFTSKHDEFVLKPFNESMGRGVTLIHKDPETDIEEEFQELLKTNRTFLMEERIIQDERLAAFNKDSLNTIRLMIYYDGENAVPVTGFFRTGREGSFVDNAGAGGIFADIDVKTGILDTDGADEKGRAYEVHPNSGLKYKGFQLPEWENAVKVGCEGNKMLGTPCFIGWDLALNDKGTWVVVEGNSYPQFVNQVPLGYGLRPYLKSILKK